jgi:hypothetical protein
MAPEASKIQGSAAIVPWNTVQSNFPFIEATRLIESFVDVGSG